jgi:AraC-like DNA-binding protein
VAGDEITTLRVSSADFSDRDRVEAFRETFGRAIMQIDIDPSPGHPLDVEMTLRALPGLGIATGRISPTHNSHPSSLIDNDDPVLVVARQGSGALKQRGREATIANGQAILTSNGMVGSFVGHVTSHVFTFRLTRDLLASRIPDLENALIRPLPANHPALQLLMGYTSALNDDQALATPELRHAVVSHVHDLAALALGMTGDSAVLANERGVKAARLRAIKADIIANCRQQHFSIEAIARQHQISPVYIRQLLAADGTTFTELVIHYRLAHAHRTLTNPRHADRAIGSIAFESGFSDLSYFNRTFRRRYGAKPSDIRANALASPPFELDLP